MHRSSLICRDTLILQLFGWYLTGLKVITFLLFEERSCEVPHGRYACLQELFRKTSLEDFPSLQDPEFAFLTVLE